MSDNNTTLRSSGDRRGDLSPFHDIIDCPDITLKKGEWITMRYKYFWHGLERKRAACEVMPCGMHLKDYIKMREKALQMAHAREFLQGAPPKLSDIWVQVGTSPPLQTPELRNALR